MKASRNWFNNRYGQSVNRDVATLPTIARSGVNGTPPPEVKKTTDKGEKVFIVGETEVGGEEVVG